MASILRPVEKKKKERQRKKQEKQIKEHPKKQKNKKLEKKNNKKREEIPNHMIIDQDLINCEDTCVKSLFQLKKELLKRNEWKQTDEEYLLKLIKFNTNKSKQEKPEEVINEKDSEKKTTNEKIINRRIEQYDGHVEYNKVAKNLIKRNKKVFKKNICPMMQIATKFWVKEEEQPKINEFKDFGINSDTCLFPMLFQNLLHIKNPIRKKSIEENHYINVFENQKLFTQTFFRDLVYKQYQKKAMEIKNELNKNIFEKKAIIFGFTKNIYQAAGLLKGVKRGVSIRHFIKILQEKKCPLIIQKLKMLLNGHFRNIPLFDDKPTLGTNQKFVSWIPSKKNFHRLYIANRDLADGKAWKNLVPQFAYLIDKNIDYDAQKNDPNNRLVYIPRKRKLGRI
ncbi:hypothetical protein M0813_15644 [Anaeramoeba flamelloides]|uniref:Uncharacterized protein n=1 Tax=Anaeramoeba flamelloides TaxID=1746091 RepID=A0ABQ8Z210_9EUKA|nr:hypothetical protein M0813_15644 [Anaeramoeba flamelloides]